MLLASFSYGKQTASRVIGVGRDESPAGSWCETGTEGWEVRLVVIMLCAI